MHPRNYAKAVREKTQMLSGGSTGETTTAPPATSVVHTTDISASASSSASQSTDPGIFSAPDQSDLFGLFVAHCPKCQMPLGVSATTYSAFTLAVRSHKC